MRVSSIQLSGFRAFPKTEPIRLAAVNVLIGENNAGKSSILRGLAAMQVGGDINAQDIRVGFGTATITMRLDDVSAFLPWKDNPNGILRIQYSSTDRRSLSMQMHYGGDNGSNIGLGQIPAVEPQHFIVPYLSKRKTASYQEDVRLQFAMQITPSFANLAAKLSRISNPSFPGHDQYRKTCEAILGFLVTAIPSEGGQRPGVYLKDGQSIPIDQMGEGVPNVAALLADLALAKGKLFLIEEPENDLHPSALKALLDLIVESSKSNQFVVSTHSNIVLKHLGSVPESLVYEIEAERGKLPAESTVRLVDPTPQARLEVLRSLGYTFSDLDLWDGWLILEESSAERIVRDYLIPWFAPKLSRVRTLAANGTGNVEPVFDDFNRLVRFTHLEKAYEGAAWVRVDGDESGQRVVTQLREKYPSWPSGSFESFSQPQFEFYYPRKFHEQVKEVVAVADRKARQKAKRELLDQVRAWLDGNPEKGKAALQESAAEVITHLITLQDALAR